MKRSRLASGNIIGQYLLLREPSTGVMSDVAMTPVDTIEYDKKTDAHL